VLAAHEHRCIAESKGQAGQAFIRFIRFIVTHIPEHCRERVDGAVYDVPALLHAKQQRHFARVQWHHIPRSSPKCGPGRRGGFDVLETPIQARRTASYDERLEGK
jgi:putative component of membrane protein insertase Oxa1/YidC/SpoIIIJ protein YidD